MLPLLVAETSSSDSFMVTPSAGLIVWMLVAVAVWMGCALAIGRLARARGQSFGLFFAVSLIASPLIAAAALILMPERAAS
ncbi:MAG: hypothetical protein Q7T55_15675 [Solirubrobacteraceae bacterium]|nr:hypothetical protein [Solirubrobacteraceae bacterium]